jgi:hypothetical protein
MKNFYTLVAALCLSFSGFAQIDYNFRVEYVSYEAGDTVSTDSLFDLQFRIINIGEVNIIAGTEFRMGWLYDGFPYNGVLSAGFDFGISADDIGPGDTLIHGFTGVDLPDVADNKTICCVFYGFAGSTPPEISDQDLDISDNTMCVYYGKAEESDDSTVSILERPTEDFAKAYISNSSLIIELNQADVNSNANMKLWSTQGRLVYETTPVWETNRSQIDLGDLSRGVYILTLDVDGKRLNQKIIY